MSEPQDQTNTAEGQSELTAVVMWRPISEAPKDGSSFIGFEKGYGRHECWWDSDHDGGNGGFRNPYHGWRPTLWQPLPDEPADT